MTFSPVNSSVLTSRLCHTPYEGWTIRQSAANGLDHLAVRFRKDLLDILQVNLDRHFKSPRWIDREAAILALGAVAFGCAPFLVDILPQLVPFLVKQVCRIVLFWLFVFFRTHRFVWNIWVSWAFCPSILILLH